MITAANAPLLGIYAAYAFTRENTSDTEDTRGCPIDDPKSSDPTFGIAKIDAIIFARDESRKRYFRVFRRVH